MALRASPRGMSDTTIVDWISSLNNLSGQEYRVAMYSGTGLIIASTTDAPAGIIKNGGTDSAVQVTLHVGGYSEGEAGGAFSFGEMLIPDSQGRLVASISAAEPKAAMALADASAAGQVIPLKVLGGAI
jgi:hypothetical protein